MKALKYIIVLIATNAFSQNVFNGYVFKEKLNTVNFYITDDNKNIRQNKRLDTINNKKDDIKAYKFDFSFPTDSLDISSSYGKRFHPVDKISRKHNGIDIKVKKAKVKSVLRAIVKDVGYTENNGNFIILDSGIYTFYYLHLDQIFVSKNENIAVGQIIGISGNTGLSTGYHLHFGIKENGVWTDPIKILRIFTEIYINQNSTK
jgi:murein DD-endopeptidase MepM/ murein hydrolase activator NlpD